MSRKMKPRAGRRLRYRMMPLAQVAVFLAAAAGAFMLFRYRSASFSVVGVVQGRISQVSATYDARIKSIPVQPYQKVRQGEVVAVLDDSLLTAQIATISAEIARLRAEYAENQALLDADVRARLSRWDAENRAFSNDSVQLSVSTQELKAVLAYDRALLEGLRAARDNAEQLVKKGLGPLADLQLAKAEYEATVKKVEENERLLARLLAERQTAQQRLADHLQHRPVSPSQEAAWEHLRQAVAVQQGLMSELEAQRAEYVLRAPCDGIVIELQGRPRDASARRPSEGGIRSPGEVVVAGQTVVAIAQAQPTEIVAYADDRQAPGLSPGLPVKLTATGRRRQVALSEIVAVAPTVQRLPEALWLDPRLPEWGRPVLVRIPPGMTLRVGERVTVGNR